MAEAAIVFIILGLTLAGFIWGAIRYDLVALPLTATVIAVAVPPVLLVWGM